MKLVDTLKGLFAKIASYKKAITDVEAKIQSVLGSEKEEDEDEEEEEEAPKKVVKKKKKKHGSK